MLQEVNVFSVFGSSRLPGLRCAVRQDCPMPPFLQKEDWTYAGTIDWSFPHRQPPVGFRYDAAHDAARSTGFYFFADL